MPIQYVGGQDNFFAGKTTTTTVAFALTNGLASVPAIGDLVIISYAVAAGAATNVTLTVTNEAGLAYTEVDVELYANDTYSANMEVAYRFMPWPEANFILSSTGNTANAAAYTVHVFRGVDPTTPFDVAAVPVTGTNGRVIDPAAITPDKTGAVIVVTGCAAGATGGTITGLTYLTDPRVRTSPDTNDVNIASGYVAWTSGQYNPAAWTGGGTTTTSDSWAAMTMALRPAPHGATGALFGTQKAGPYAAVPLDTPGPDWTGNPSTTDSSGSATIGALITAAGTNATVTIPGDKIYTISTALVPLDGQTIRAASGSKVVLRAANALGAVPIFSMPGLSGVTIQNIRIDGNFANRSAQEGVPEAAMSYISGGQNLTFLNCDFVNAPDAAVWSYNHSNLQIRNCSGSENWMLLQMDGNTLYGVLIEGNQFTNTSLYKSYQGLEIIYSVGVIIRGNKMGGWGLTHPLTGTAEPGTYGNTIFLVNVKNYLIENNDFTVQCDWSSLVCGSGCTNGTVIHNALSKGTIGGQAMWYEQVGADYLTVHMNTLRGGLLVGDGTDLPSGDHFTFTFNEVSTDGVGIDISVYCRTATISDNKFTRTGGTPADNGTYIYHHIDPLTDIHFERNVMTNYATAIAINNYGGTGTAYGLTVTGNTYVGCTAGIVIDGDVVVSGSTLQSVSAEPTPWPFGVSIIAGASAGTSADVALSGTVTASITENDIRAGGKTIILTLTGDSWIP